VPMKSTEGEGVASSKNKIIKGAWQSPLGMV
jgi:hypothetical protein